MPYSTKQDILNQIDEPTLAALTSDQGDVIDQIVIDRAIVKADALIDSYAGKRCVVPFVDPIPSEVNTASASIAIFFLFQQRSSKVGGVSESVRQAYEDQIGWLKDVSSGKAVIGGAQPKTMNPNTTGGKFSAQKRIFTEDGMKNY